MTICLCNGLTDAQVAEAIRQGARRPREIQARCGCGARCGRCAADLRAALRDAARIPAKQDR